MQEFVRLVFALIAPQKLTLLAITDEFGKASCSDQ
jgi:hypothetical protein